MTLAPVRSQAVLYCKLSWRELDIVRELIKDGADNETLGRRLRIDMQTAKSHLRSTMRKTEMPTRTALAVAVLQGDLVLLDPNSRVVEF